MKLRDIQVPDPVTHPVSWWPPALGWWLILLLFCLCVVAAIFFWKRYQQRALSRAALTELDKIEAHHQQQPDNLRQLAKDLSALLRRTSISLLDRQTIAALSGEQWLAWLDQQTDSEQFQNGAGIHLISAPYQAKPEYHPESLIELCRHWLQTVPMKKGMLP